MQPPKSMDISNRKITQALSTFDIALSSEQIAMVHEYVLLLVKWNRSISLTAITDPDEIVSRHFGESMFGAKLLPVENCRLADVGTGPGFPGIPLKILAPNLQLVLIESNKKKCAFLSEVVRSLGMSDVEVLMDRFEQIRPETIKANFITSRALGEFKELLRWSSEALIPGGHVMLWLGQEDATRVANYPGWVWSPSIRIPNSQRRCILIGRRISEGTNF